MTRTQFVAVALLSLTFSAPLAAQRPGRVLAGRRGQPTQSQAASRVTLAFQGRRREYLLHVPTRPNGALLLAFHGGGETPENQEEISGFDALSDREGFIVAYPAGIDHSWADGRGTTAADRQHIDDVGFTRAVVADIARSHRVDSTRVYATGPSNGGIFVSRLGCDASDLFAGIAPVIGTIASALTPQCHPARHLTVVGIQGVADPVVPFDGGDVGGSIENAAAGGSVQSSRFTQELWRTFEGCGETVSASPLPMKVRDGTSATKREFTGCKNGVTVAWYEIAGGGHRWPPHKSSGVTERVAEKKLGISSQNIDASAVIWAAFASHPRR